jgi:outer membrane lipoprotein LolB
MAAAALFLGACAPVVQRPLIVGSEATQAAREKQLAARPAWAFTGRLAVSQGSNGGNARVQWRQDGPDFDIQLSAPITRQSWRLKQVGGKVSLEGLEGGPREGSDAEAMLREATGWRIPLTEMAAWVRGVRAPGPSELGYDPHGLPATLSQDGWTVEYRAWSAGTPPLPEKVFARQGEASVRLLIESWDAP